MGNKKTQAQKKPGGSAEEGTTLPLDEHIEAQFKFLIDPDILQFYEERPTKEMMSFCMAMHSTRRLNRIVNSMASI